MDFRLPPPILPGLAIIDHIRPRISNTLPVIRFVCDCQRDVFVDRSCQFFNCKTDSCHVVAGSHPDLLAVGLHQLDGASNSVIHEDHWDCCFLVDEAFVCAFLESAVEDSDSVVCSPSAGQFFPADDTRISQRSHIESKFLIVVLS